MADLSEAREAKYGKRMIEIKVRFWTDSIADGKGNIVPKHAWDAGVVRIDRNSEHDIVPTKPVPFNGLADLPGKIEKVLIEQDIRLHMSRKTRKYLVAE